MIEEKEGIRCPEVEAEETEKPVEEPKKKRKKRKK